VLDLSHPDALHPLLHSRFNEILGEVSPDGDSIAYESNESSDRTEVFVRPFPDVTGRRVQVSSDGGRFPMWARHSRELSYVDSTGTMMSAAVVLDPTLRLGKVTPLFRTEKPPVEISGRPYDVSPKDGRFLVTKPVPSPASDAFEISVVLNWFTELGQPAATARR